jgi:serine/threonine-protein kinase RsbT
MEAGRMMGTLAAGARADRGLPLSAPVGQEQQRNEGVAIRSETDIVTARQRGRALAIRLGFTATEATLVATAISELARNIILYAERGAILLKQIEEDTRPGILVVARDEGPGIADVQRAMTGGYSTSGGLGLGLCGVKRLVDEFEIASEPGRGTTVTFKKWKG